MIIMQIRRLNQHNNFVGYRDRLVGLLLAEYVTVCMGFRKGTKKCR
jgi:hypothetical protein